METGFNNQKYKRANDNFCLFHYKRMRIKSFHFHLNINYYTSRCGLQQNTFYGFENDKLVEVVQCSFYVHDQKWAFVELVEPVEDDAVDVRKMEIYSFENHWKSLEKIRNVVRITETKLNTYNLYIQGDPKNFL